MVSEHRILESVRISENSTLSGEFSAEIDDYYRGLTGYGDLGWSASQFLKGTIGEYVTDIREHGLTLTVFDNMCVRALPSRATVKTKTKVDACVTSVVDLLLDKGYSLETISLVLKDINMSYGFALDKRNKSIYVEVNEYDVTIKYQNVSKYDMLSTTQELDALSGIDSFNLAGTFLLNTFKSFPELGLSQTHNEDFTAINLKMKTKFLKLKPRKFSIDLSNPSMIMEEKSMKDILGLPDKYNSEYAEDLSAVFVGMILEFIANIGFHNYKDYNNYYVLEYDGIDVPFLVAEGYMSGVRE